MTVFVYIDNRGVPSLYASAQAAQLHAVEDNCVRVEEGHSWNREGLCLNLYVRGGFGSVARVWERLVLDEVEE